MSDTILKGQGCPHNTFHFLSHDRSVPCQVSRVLSSPRTASTRLQLPAQPATPQAGSAMSLPSAGGRQRTGAQQTIKMDCASASGLRRALQHGGSVLSVSLVARSCVVTSTLRHGGMLRCCLPGSHRATFESSVRARYRRSHRGAVSRQGSAQHARAACREWVALHAGAPGRQRSALCQLCANVDGCRACDKLMGCFMASSCSQAV